MFWFLLFNFVPFIPNCFHLCDCCISYITVIIIVNFSTYENACFYNKSVKLISELHLINVSNTFKFPTFNILLANVLCNLILCIIAGCQRFAYLCRDYIMNVWNIRNLLNDCSISQRKKISIIQILYIWYTLLGNRCQNSNVPIVKVLNPKKR